MKNFIKILIVLFALNVGNARAQLNYSSQAFSAGQFYGSKDFTRSAIRGSKNSSPQGIYLFPDSAGKKGSKKFCNSCCFGTSLVPILNLVSYNSFYLNEKVKFRGFKVGAEIGKKVRFGIGASWLDKPIDLAPVISDSDTTKRQLHFEYTNLFLEYIFFEDFKWEVSLPLSIGRAFGKIDTFSVKSNSRHGKINVDSTGLATIGVDCAYRIIPWLGLGGGVGYRQALAPKDIREKLNAPYYTIKVKIFLGYLFKAIFRKGELAEEKNAYKKERDDRKKARTEKKKKNDEVEKIDGIEKPENKNDY